MADTYDRVLALSLLVLPHLVADGASILPAPVPPATQPLHAWLHTFRPFTLTHTGVVAVFITIAAPMILFRRHSDVGGVPIRRKALDRAVGGVGLSAMLLVQSAEFFPPSVFDYTRSLPLHVCDVMMAVAPLSLLLDYRPLRAITYFWGLGISSIAFVLPDLSFGPGDFQFYLFWLGHAVIVFTALYDVTARGFRPRPSDFRIAAACGVIYGVSMFLIDWRLHLNYGYLGVTEKGQRSPTELLGPWPWRAPLMVGAALSIMALLLLPWTLWRRAQAPVASQRPIRKAPSKRADVVAT